MAEATQTPAAPAQPARRSAGSVEFSVNELVSSRAALWGVRPAMIRAALAGKQRVGLDEAEKLVKEFAKTDLTATTKKER